MELPISLSGVQILLSRHILVLRRAGALAMGCLLLIILAACSDPRVDGLGLGEERKTSNEAQITADMISAIKQVSLQRHPQEVMKRFNQSKTIACFDAQIKVDDDLPAELSQGIFSEPRSYSAKLRFANATKFDDREKDFRGLSLSVFGINGQTLWGESGRQDFLLNSYPVLFARDGSDFLEFIEATRDDKIWKYFVRPSHFYSLITALRGRDKINNPFAIQYWSTTPFRHGLATNTAVKYSVKACANEFEQKTNADTEDFFTTAMAEQLAVQTVCLDFMVQQQTDPQAMPIEDASVVWDEDDAPFRKVATITINQQNFQSKENQQTCEAYSFNPWQAIAEHQPLGDINRLRRAIYAEMATFRTDHNQQYGGNE